jgi:hypothetical protein
VEKDFSQIIAQHDLAGVNIEMQKSELNLIEAFQILAVGEMMILVSTKSI